ncbi:MAG: chromosome segregation protein SMC, partial [Methylobacteriaceae bacterium]|nr:chromosome segregation protein SMC [Methylobacteriaceae bacterium]
DALRWVMGENSFKSMRGSAMDDVIFSGSGNRPSRNTAEVHVFIDNAERQAPAAFNDTDALEISRRIERDEGSTYRINGREVRARDVQLLFADASTGARSPAFVGQGRIGEIISAKPQQRRRILEEAAGVAGLHSRRHEAELRLKAAQDNLNRLEDVLKQVEAQIESLKKQARQATRYRNLAGEIRKNEALLALIRHREAAVGLGEAERRLEADVREVAERTTAQAEAARLQALAAADLPGLRDAEAKAGAALQRLNTAREQLEAEEQRVRERMAELERRIEQLGRDLERERALVEDAAGVTSRLEAEDAELVSAGEVAGAQEETARARVAASSEALATAEAALTEAQTALADAKAKRAALEAALGEARERLARGEAELTRVDTEFALISGEREAADMSALSDALAAHTDDARAAEERASAAESAHGAARDAETGMRGPLAQAEQRAQRLETEARTLSKLLESGTGGLWPTVIEQMSVDKGYEAAVGAVLGDDLEASTDASAPAHWALIEAAGDPPLPPGVASLAEHVQAPPALARRLAQIGIVLRGEGQQLHTLLKPGQCLVSREGDLWRWDGLTHAAEAPTPAVRRLAERNRLQDLLREGEEARAEADEAAAAAQAARADVERLASEEASARQSHRAARATLDETRERHAAAERRRAQVVARLAALEEAKSRLAVDRDEFRRRRDEAEAALSGTDISQALAADLDRARGTAAEARAEASEARAALDALRREAQAREARREAIARDAATWNARRERALTQIGELEARRSEAETEQRNLAEAPDNFLQQRRALMSQTQAAEAARQAAADALAAGESALADADRQARAALEAMSGAREAQARSEARLDAARERLAQTLHAITLELDCTPEDLVALAGVKPGADLPDAASVEQKLDSQKSERERLGAVNLRADEELQEIEASRERMIAERDDLNEAIKKLRTAIGNLNKEGRERLLAAFEQVNAHFTELFTLLFGGGTAELQLIESEDPLEAGLDILARPPGKKPQTMTLLSGGEQALTALSLIFAVFLTNPSPICVLDEVDAPLDDSNVERFCDLLDEMRKKTETRFVTITHNPITMARMDRLFGVTMAERGVSTLVSVDLQQAERFLEAG